MCICKSFVISNIIVIVAALVNFLPRPQFSFHPSLWSCRHCTVVCFYCTILCRIFLFLIVVLRFCFSFPFGFFSLRVEFQLSFVLFFFSLLIHLKISNKIHNILYMLYMYI